MTTIKSINDGHPTRKPRGATTMALVLVTAFFVILPLGILGFELARASLVQQELQNVTDATALTGTATLASPGGTINYAAYNYAQVQTTAMQDAYWVFWQNGILQTQFSTANVTPIYAGPLSGVPPKYNAIVAFQLYNSPNSGSPQVQSLGSSTATTMQVNSAFTEVPVFACSLIPGLAQYTVTAVSWGGLPQLDIVLCFDVSASMDDSTPVRLYSRYWNYTNGAIFNQQVSSNSFTIDGRGVISPNIYDMAVPAPNGTPTNIQTPQQLGSMNFPNANNSTYNGGNGSYGIFYFSESTSGQAPNTLNPNGGGYGWSSAAMPSSGSQLTVNPEIYLDGPYAATNPATQIGSAFSNMENQLVNYGQGNPPTNPYLGLRANNWYYTPGVLAGAYTGIDTSGTIAGQPTLTNIPFGNLIPEQGLPPGNWDPTVVATVPGQFRQNGMGAYGTVWPIPAAYSSPSSHTALFTDMVPYVGAQWATAASSYGYTAPSWITNPSTFPITITEPSSGTSYTFSSDSDLIEASRGNLDPGPQGQYQYLNSAQVNPTSKSGNEKDSNPGVDGSTGKLSATPSRGYYYAYWFLCRSLATPVSEANTAAYNFFFTLNSSANCHFALVTFNDTIGNGSTTDVVGSGDTAVWTDSSPAAAPGYADATTELINSIDDVMPYPLGGNATAFTSPFSTGTSLQGWPLPLIALNSTNGNFLNSGSGSVLQPLNPQPASSTALPGLPDQALTLGPTGYTNIAAALQEAYNELTGGQARPAPAHPKIVLFTDGVPDYSSGGGSAPDFGAFAVATLCKPAGIPIYTIGLSLNSAIINQEANILGDGIGSPATPQGISYLAGNRPSGQQGFYQVTNPAALNQAFQLLARTFVQLQSSN